MRWMPLQNVESRKWALCVLFDDCRTYEVTEITADQVEPILRYAAYLNEGADGGMEAALRERLDHLKKRYTQ